MNASCDINRKVQVLRAFAIMAVVFIHTCPDGVWQVAARPFVNFGVGLFLFLSGWLTKDCSSDWGKVCRRRILRVMIPYAIWTVVYSLQMGTPDKIFFNLLTTKASSSLYYIFVYVQFVLLTPLLMRLARSRYRWLGLIVAPVSVALCVYVPMIFGFDFGKIGGLVWNVCCLGWFSFYYLGLLTGNGYAGISGRTSVSGSVGVSECASVQDNVPVNVGVPVSECTGVMQRGVFLHSILGLSVVLQILEGWLWYESGWPNCGSQLKLTSILTTSAVLLLADAWLKSGSSLAGYYGSSGISGGSLDGGSDLSACSCIPDVSGGLRNHPGFLTRIGDFSFGIYFVHIPVIRFLQLFSWYTALPFGLNTALVAAISIVAVALFSRLLGPRVSRLFGLQ